MDGLPEDLRLAVGDVVLAATRVELALVQVIRRMEVRDWDWAVATLEETGGARKAFKKLAGQYTGIGRDDLQDLFERAGTLLDERNAIVHGLLEPVSHDGGNSFFLSRFSARDRTYTPVSVGGLQQTATQLRRLDADLSAFRIAHFAPPPDAAEPWI